MGKTKLMERHRIGQAAEKAAANYLIAQGYRLLAGHYYNAAGYHLGEIDLIAEDPQKTLVFVEVKARKGRPDRSVPEENITAGKLRKITKVAHRFLAENGWIERVWRIDAISVTFDFFTRRMAFKQLRNIRL